MYTRNLGDLLPDPPALPVDLNSSGAISTVALLDKVSLAPMVQSAEAAGARQFSAAGQIQTALSKVNPQVMLYGGLAIALVLLAGGRR